MSNFTFLKEKWPILENLGRLAERNLYIDSNTTFIKCGMFGEIVVQYMFSMEDMDTTLIAHDNSHNNRIKLLKKEDLIPEDIDNILHMLRLKRNDAAHNGFEDVEKAKVQLELTFKLAIWFMQTYGDWNFEPKAFEMPDKQENEYGDNVNDISKEYEEKYKALEAELNDLKAQEKDKEELEKRREQGKKASRRIELSEAETRRIIDDQLKSAGWGADTINIRYSKGTRPQKGRNLAIAEWPTYSIEKGNGKVDYALFIGEKLVGFVEAKKYSKDVAGTMIEAKNYAVGVKEEHEAYVISKWNDYKVPFLFAANGRKYIKEIEDKSGVHFLDCRNARNNDKVLQGWYSPEKLEAMLEENIEEANKSLDELSFEFLKSENSIGLRDYQVEAIKAVEKVITDGKERSALVTMATGTGKTRTVLGLIYRLIKTNRYKRILFLVDRTSLGDQAFDTFKEVKIEDLKTLNQIYNINGLDEKLIDKETKIHIATVQAMVKRIMYNEDETNVPSVGDYDCIIVDEAHRGYTLDKEMTDTEVEWRDDRDFLSKYKKVIEYFDAFKVALTATPALHTTMIFGNPVYNYSYRDAVIDGYLVDHEPPHLIETELTRDGVHYNKGDKVAKYNKYTGELINGAELEDNIDFEIDQFNKKVIVEAHTRAALEEVANYIDPENDKGKTLIFAASDAHADMIVRLLKDIYKETIGGVDDNSILKITGAIKDPDLAIKKFKNETYPNIAVTVDLLSTGIDVPKIDKIVFLRRVKSRILYEQMLGRATRLCDDIQKTHFEIFDCVRLYEALKDMTNMKPVAANANASFKILKETLERVESIEEKEAVVNKVIAKLQRKKKLIDENERLIFTSLCNDKTPEEFINELRGVDTETAAKEIIRNNSLVEYLDEKYTNEEIIIVSDKEDKVVSHTRGYGKGKKPEDYIDEFKKYIEENKNTIQALEVVCTRPQDLTKETLKQLKAILDNKGFNEEYLKTAWKDLNNEEIVADIIAFIRQQALGSPLESNEVRVKRAVSKIKKEYYFTKPQENWLNKIEKVMLKEVVINKETLNTGSFFSQSGGFDRLNEKMFNGNLEDIINKLKTYMFEDKGIS
ncbi:type I restriction-modification system endonuclease [Clostridium beijerinckii]|uniref:type I restriction-modification system endonuclease n=1 Tax=Clostridium beijerinckii TaxID=1520 RepID=UPI00136102BA|nr:type I restriction-modification system endonuclease [Clostridium beijerinckii]MZK50959.1 type I restriction-modification system endonuclease [Clostridium beijerinckii]MZK59161.1 type I restriction-modification system endonuclease [Clostridium beijerinckii]MZK69280.1 type I restriction-modification system endonuclease [Clostridium beijerinckii]MZK74653.1 type I restriction-modification system endonuclease [Clostridium beijerinckii]MZK84372.1 type I restriction-modification system endonucleas